MWELEPEQVEEQRVLGGGGYVGVRRVVSEGGREGGWLSTGRGRGIGAECCSALFATSSEETE